MIIKALCVALLAYLSAAPSAPTTAASEFEYACAYADVFYGVECGDLQPPLVITSRVVSDRFYGFYIPGEPFIFINKRLWLHDKPQWRETVVHESMHYILHEKADERFGRCESEEAARRVGASYMGIPYNEDWRTQYQC